ncbi:hypothetical protein D1007_08312 [Hordeum vulgare]|uniref:Uncharacterized protein n=1 Tax=Hordeum vulgare subsp. vulgare TaxID=112509 RepID=A0A8I7BK67_HORVV|nr:protein DMP7-like [Hordeum vulgare subsp. vulgare]KAE8814254.1 hypothetical protein D1007_08312 [Hordeum vulgare]
MEAAAAPAPHTAIGVGGTPVGAVEPGADGKTCVTQKVLSVSANLVQLLPTGSVMAYQILAPSFSNQGKCYPSNWWITLGLVVLLAASCVFFAFTDSVIHKGKVYYGIATYEGLNVFNISKKDQDKEFESIKLELKKRHIKKQDFVHAFLTVVVFLTMAFSDVGLQNCFFPKAGTDAQQLLKNLPLGMAVFSSLVFTIFPSKRNFIGCNDPNSDSHIDVAKVVPKSPSSSTATTRCPTCPP